MSTSPTSSPTSRDSLIEGFVTIQRYKNVLFTNQLKVVNKGGHVGTRVLPKGECRWQIYSCMYRPRLAVLLQIIWRYKEHHGKKRENWTAWKIPKQNIKMSTQHQKKLNPTVLYS